MKWMVGIVLVSIVAFTTGWWIGHTSAIDADTSARLAKIEADLQALRSPTGRTPVSTQRNPAYRPGLSPARMAAPKVAARV